MRIRYPCSPSRSSSEVNNYTVLAGMSRDMADLFLDALRKQTTSLETLISPLPDRATEEVSTFKH